MIENKWLPLLDYARQENVSPSTVRRQIKTGRVEFRLDSGKYLIRAPQTLTNQSNPDGILRYAEEALQSLKEAHRAILVQKQEEIGRLQHQNLRLQQELNELKMLIEVLEKRPTS
ncbi:MAG TPA: hypothetical protein VJL87_01635 [Bdellovibrionota bacterium]|nr:hypothetical protein [Bdellovibrionota bacterium]